MSAKCINKKCPVFENCERPLIDLDREHIKDKSIFHYESNEANGHPCFIQRKKIVENKS
ncbi:MAG: hypothetical protein KQ78_02109 [Candidatus Izimaplasma bacterium HR2]|nr:MAG: hypothetical protein KQ78_02109 [Candidatus Izimaplasma bacterium HR2]